MSPLRGLTTEYFRATGPDLLVRFARLRRRRYVTELFFSASHRRTLHCVQAVMTRARKAACRSPVLLVLDLLS